MSAATHSATTAQRVALPVLVGLSASHMLNDMIQSLLPSTYPILQRDLALSFGQVGFITFAFQVTASVLQPMVGVATDKRPQPFSMVVGMCSSLLGLLLLSQAHVFALVLLAASLIGVGSSIFHPEASRVARAASGGRFGFAQSFFQVGGNTGQAIGPLLAALIIVPLGQSSIALFAILAFLGMAVLTWIGRWYATHLGARKNALSPPALTRTQWLSIAILLALVFSKNAYMASLQTFYSFFLMKKFGLGIAEAQIYLFVFMASVAAGTLLGGPIGDRLGRLVVIWVSIVGVLPFSLALPYANFAGTVALTAIIGFVMASSFPAILVYAQELAPGRVGMIGGLFFGFAFGTGGLAAAALGLVADRLGLDFVYAVCSFLPAIGLLLLFMPKRVEAKTA